MDVRLPSTQDQKFKEILGNTMNMRLAWDTAYHVYN